jgi:hypothetical protein
MLEQTSRNAAAHVADADKPKSGIFISEQDIYLSIFGIPTVAATKIPGRVSFVLLIVAWSYRALLSLGSAFCAFKPSLQCHPWFTVEGVRNPKKGVKGCYRPSLTFSKSYS